MIVYDITNPDSFAHLSKWVHDITAVSLNITLRALYPSYIYTHMFFMSLYCLLYSETERYMSLLCNIYLQLHNNY